jgi:hypothetical protein
MKAPLHDDWQYSPPANVVLPSDFGDIKNNKNNFCSGKRIYKYRRVVAPTISVEQDPEVESHGVPEIRPSRKRSNELECLHRFK